MTDFLPDSFSWFLPETAKEKAAEDAPAGDAAAQAAAAQPDTTPPPGAKHIEVGKQLQAAFPSIKPTKDIYGKGAQEHGSPWKGDPADYEGIKTKLRQLGYRPKSKDVYVRFPVEVDLGQDKTALYLYITDDNPR